MEALKNTQPIKVIPLLAVLLLMSACGGLESDSDGTLSSAGSTPVLPETEPDDPAPPPEEEPSTTPEPPPTTEAPEPIVPPPPAEEPSPTVTPTLLMDDVVVTEGDSGTVAAALTLRLSEPSQATVSVDWSTSAVTATSGADFGAAQGTATFPAGAATRTITIQVLGDSTDEPDETFRINLRNPANATLDRDSAVVTISDDDAQPTLGVFGTGVTEGQSGTTSARFSVALSDISAWDVTVDYYTIDGTATRDQDFEFSTGTLTIPAGQDLGTIVVPVIGDTVEEPEETFELVLENATNATITTSSASGVIEDDDAVRTATLSWQAPLTNVDGSCLDDLEGYQVSAGNGAGNYTRTDRLSVSSGDVTCEQTSFDATCSVPVMTCTYTMGDLTPGTWFFAVQAYDQAMNYSPYSNELSGDIQ